MTFYQGEDIEFSLSLKDIAENSLKSWDDVARFVVYFYTHTNHIAKFSTLVEEGYIQLVKSSNTQVVGVIPSEYTRTMNGTLRCDVYALPKNGSVDKITTANTGITILQTPISIETK